MTDSRLREFERRWRDSQSIEDEASWFLERVRVGETSAAELRSAAAVGLPAARRALGVDGDPASLEHALKHAAEVYPGWVLLSAVRLAPRAFALVSEPPELMERGIRCAQVLWSTSETSLAALRALAEAEGESLDRFDSLFNDDLPRALLGCTEQWLRDPTEAAAEQCRLQLRQLCPRSILGPLDPAYQSLRCATDAAAWNTRAGCGGVMSAEAGHRYLAQKTASEEGPLRSIRQVAAEVIGGRAEVRQFLERVSG